MTRVLQKSEATPTWLKSWPEFMVGQIQLLRVMVQPDSFLDPDTGDIAHLEEDSPLHWHLQPLYRPGHTPPFAVVSELVFTENDVTVAGTAVIGLSFRKEKTALATWDAIGEDIALWLSHTIWDFMRPQLMSIVAATPHRVNLPQLTPKPFIVTDDFVSRKTEESRESD